MKPRWMNDDYDKYLEPPTEPRYVVCANCGEWIDQTMLIGVNGTLPIVMNTVLKKPRRGSNMERRKRK